jgi:hypothetical protein
MNKNLLSIIIEEMDVSINYIYTIFIINFKFNLAKFKNTFY